MFFVYSVFVAVLEVGSSRQGGGRLFIQQHFIDAGGKFAIPPAPRTLSTPPIWLKLSLLLAANGVSLSRFARTIE